MKIIVSGEQHQIDRYRSFIEACLRHFDSLKIAPSWGGSAVNARGFYDRSVLEEAHAPSSEWEFVVTFDDENFGLWFKLKYA